MMSPSGADAFVDICEVSISTPDCVARHPTHHLNQAIETGTSCQQRLALRVTADRLLSACNLLVLDFTHASFAIPAGEMKTGNVVS